MSETGSGEVRNDMGYAIVFATHLARSLHRYESYDTPVIDDINLRYVLTTINTREQNPDRQLLLKATITPFWRIGVQMQRYFGAEVVPAISDGAPPMGSALVAVGGMVKAIGIYADALTHHESTDFEVALALDSLDGLRQDIDTFTDIDFSRRDRLGMVVTGLEVGMRTLHPLAGI